MVQRPPKFSEDLIIMSMSHSESTSFLLYMDTDYLSVKIIIDYYPKFSFVGLTADQTFGAPVFDRPNQLREVSCHGTSLKMGKAGGVEESLGVGRQYAGRASSM